MSNLINNPKITNIHPDKNAVVTYVSNEPSNVTGVLELTWNTIIDKL